MSKFFEGQASDLLVSHWSLPLVVPPLSPSFRYCEVETQMSSYHSLDTHTHHPLQVIADLRRSGEPTDSDGEDLGVNADEAAVMFRQANSDDALARKFDHTLYSSYAFRSRMTSLVLENRSCCFARCLLTSDQSRSGE